MQELTPTTDSELKPVTEEELDSIVEAKIKVKNNTWYEFYKRYCDNEERNHVKAYKDVYGESLSYDVSRAAGSRLLRKIDELIGYREIMTDEGISDRALSKKGKTLLSSTDERVAARVLDTLTKSRGWHKQELDLGAGAEIIIVRRAVGEEPAERINATVESVPDKPKALTE